MGVRGNDVTCTGVLRLGERGKSVTCNGFLGLGERTFRVPHLAFPCIALASGQSLGLGNPRDPWDVDPFGLVDV